MSWGVSLTAAPATGSQGCGREGRFRAIGGEEPSPSSAIWARAKRRDNEIAGLLVGAEEAPWSQTIAQPSLNETERIASARAFENVKPFTNP